MRAKAGSNFRTHNSVAGAGNMSISVHGEVCKLWLCAWFAWKNLTVCRPMILKIKHTVRNRIN